jgi:hypothetical protein
MNASFLCRRCLTQESWTLRLFRVAAFVWTAVTISWSLWSSCSSTLQACVSSLPESAFTFTGKRKIRGGCVVSASELALFRSLVLTVCQHYVAFYVCNVPLPPDHMKILCTVNVVRCIWCEVTSFSCDFESYFVIKFRRFHGITIWSSLFLSCYVGSSFTKQSVWRKYMLVMLTFCPLVWVQYCTRCFSAQWRPLKLTWLQVQILKWRIHWSSVLCKHVVSPSCFVCSDNCI